MPHLSPTPISEEDMQVHDNKNEFATITHLECVNVEVKSIDEKALLRKLDLNLVPWVTFLFVFSFLDRSSIGNARVSRY
jgi:hypothetical protein